MYSEISVTRGSPFTPPVKSDTSTIGADSSPTVDRIPLYSGNSVTRGSPFTPPVKSDTSTVGVASSPDVPKSPV